MAPEESEKPEPTPPVSGLTNHASGLPLPARETATPITRAGRRGHDEEMAPSGKSGWRIVLMSLFERSWPIVLGAFVGIPFWLYQQSIQQRWSSRPVVEFSLTDRRDFRIQNRGAVGISEVSIGVTAYRIGGTVHRKENTVQFSPRDQIEAFTKYPGPLTTVDSIASGHTFIWSLPQAESEHFRFEFYEPTDADDTHFQRYFALRIVFRNAVSKQRYIKYVLVPAMRGGWSFAISDDTWYGTTVSLENSADIDDLYLNIRDRIRRHQGLLFDDTPSEMYQ
jgi:hypothetical protein